MRKSTQRKQLIAIGILIALYIGYVQVFGYSDRGQIQTARALCNSHKYSSGLETLDSVEKDVLAAGDKGTIGALYTARAECMFFSTQRDKSKDAIKDALAAAEKSVSYLGDGGDKELRARSLLTRGMAYTELVKHENPKENLAKAIEDFKSAFKLWEELGDDENGFYSRNFLAQVLFSLGDANNDKEYIRQSIDIFEGTLADFPSVIPDQLFAATYISLARSYQSSWRLDIHPNAQKKCIANYDKGLALMGKKIKPGEKLKMMLSKGYALTSFAFPRDRICQIMPQCFDAEEIDVQSIDRVMKFYDSMMDQFPADEFPKEHSYIAVTRAELWTIAAPRLGHDHYSNAIAVLKNVQAEFDDEELRSLNSQPLHALQGDAYYGLARAKQDVTYTQKAIEAYEIAIDKTLPEESATKISLQTRLGLSHLLMFKLKQDEADMQQALALFRKADTECIAEIMPDVCFITGYNLGDAYAELAGQADPEENRQKAVAAYKKSLAIPGLDSGTKRYKRVQEKLQKVQALAGIE